MRYVFNGMLIGALFAAVGCTRAELETSKVSFEISKSFLAQQKSLNAASGTPQLSHLVFNVTGSGIEGRLFCDLERKGGKVRAQSGPCGILETPTGWQLTLDVPRGGKLLQLLMALETSDGEDLFYGDAQRDLQGAETVVDIPMSRLGGDMAEMKHISGQWLTDASGGPSGELTVAFSPGAGKPPMVIVKGEAYGGWFDGPIMSGVKFEYRIGQELLFGRAVNFEDIQQLQATNPTRILIPSNGGEITGYFGPGSAGKKVCSLSSCPSADYGAPWVGHLGPSFRFAGPFVTANGAPMAWVSGGNFNWSVNPALRPGDVDGYSVFVHPTLTQADIVLLDDLKRGHGLLDCSGLRKIPGFVEHTLAASVSTLPVPSSDVTAIVCARRAGRVMMSAASNQDIFGNGNHGPGGPTGPYMRFQFMGLHSGDTVHITTGQCYQVEIGIYENSQPAPVSQDVVFQLATNGVVMSTTSGAIGSFYNSGSCGAGGEINTITLQNGNDKTSAFWFRPTAPGLHEFPASIVPVGAPFGWEPQHNKMQVNKPHLAIAIPDKVLPDICYRLDAAVMDPSAGGFMPSPSAFTANLSVSGLSLYTNPACDAPLAGPELVFSLHQTSKEFYMKTTTGGSLSVLNPTSLPVSAGGPHSVSVGAGNNVFAYVKIEPLQSPLLIDRCQSARVSLRNQEDAVIIPDQSFNVSLSASAPGVSFFDGSSCGNTPASTVNFSTGLPASKTVQFRVHSVPGGLPYSNLQLIGGVGALRTTTPPQTVDVPTGTGDDSMYVYVYQTASANVLKAEVWGSHEFESGAKYAIVRHSPGTLKCFQASTPCDHKLSVVSGETRFTFTAGDASSNVEYTLRLSQNPDGSGYQRHKYISFERVFPRPGLNPRTFITCTNTIGGGSLNLTTVKDAFNGVAVAGALCLRSGTTITQTAAADQIAGMNKALIGPADQTALMTPVTTAATTLIVTTGSGEFTVANIHFDLSGTGYAAQAIQSSDANILKSSGNRFTLNTAVSSQLGISLTNVPLISAGDTFSGVSGSAIGISHNITGQIWVQRGNFTLAHTNSRALSLTMNATSSSALDFDSGVVNGIGAVAVFSGSSTASPIHYIRESEIDLQRPGGAGLFELTNRTGQLYFQMNKLRVSGGGYAVYWDNSSAGYRNIESEQNLYEQHGVNPMFKLVGNYGSASLVSSGDHFVYHGSSITAPLVYSEISTIANLVLTTQSSRMCSASDTANWYGLSSITYTGVWQNAISDNSIGAVNTHGLCRGEL